MNVAPLLIGYSVFLVVWTIRSRKRKRPAAPTAGVGDISKVFDRLKTQGKDGSFAVFVFPPTPGAHADDYVNLQLSIESGRVGLDWYLIGPANVRDRGKFERFVTSLGYTVRPGEAHPVQYLRVEDGDLPRLCEQVVCDLYAKPRDVRMDLVVEGVSSA
jgi:hypothetical protein